MCGGGLREFQTAAIVLKGTSSISEHVSTSSFCRGGQNECKTTPFVTGTSFNLLTCIIVFFLFYIILSGDVS